MANQDAAGTQDRADISRRAMLRGAAVGGAVVAAGAGLAACSSADPGSGSLASGADATTGAAATTASAATTAPRGDNSTTRAAPTTTADGGGAPVVALAKTAEIPVGNGKIVQVGGAVIVVTQPQPGTFKAFSGVCTHMGCNVNNVSNGTISCPCHGSKFSVADGSVTGGPAPSPLPAVPVTVKGGSVVKS
jgi:Rieske Fe-S protein